MMKYPARYLPTALENKDKKNYKETSIKLELTSFILGVKYI